MKAKAVFLIVWKTWKNYKIYWFSTTKEAWQYVHKHKIISYSVYWATEELQHSNSTVGLREHIEQIIKENPEIMVGWDLSPLSTKLSTNGEKQDEMSNL